MPATFYAFYLLENIGHLSYRFFYTLIVFWLVTLELLSLVVIATLQSNSLPPYFLHSFRYTYTYNTTEPCIKVNQHVAKIWWKEEVILIFNDSKLFTCEIDTFFYE